MWWQAFVQQRTTVGSLSLARPAPQTKIYIYLILGLLQKFLIRFFLILRGILAEVSKGRLQRHVILPFVYSNDSFRNSCCEFFEDFCRNGDCESLKNSSRNCSGNSSRDSSTHSFMDSFRVFSWNSPGTSAYILLRIPDEIL